MIETLGETQHEYVGVWTHFGVFDVFEHLASVFGCLSDLLPPAIAIDEEVAFELAFLLTCPCFVLLDRFLVLGHHHLDERAQFVS